MLEKTDLIDLLCLTPLSAIFQLPYIMATSFSDGRSWITQREPPTMCKQLLNFIICTLFCNLQSQMWTHAVLVIGLYELLGNPTT